MDALIAFWSHALAAALFAPLMIWRLGEASRQPAQRCLPAHSHSPRAGRGSGGRARRAVVGFAESARNLLWISLLYSLSARERRAPAWAPARLWRRRRGDRHAADRRHARPDLSPSEAIAQTGLILRITTAAGALILVHNLYGQAAPGEPLALALPDARPGGDVGLRPPSLHRRLFHARAVGAALFALRGLAVALPRRCSRSASRNESGGASRSRGRRPSSRSRCSRSSPISR